MLTSGARKKTTRFISILMYALFLCIAVLLYTFSSNWQAPVQVFHIATELLCMAVITVLYSLHLGKIYSNDARNKYFTSLCVLIFFALFLDVISWIIDGSVQYMWLNRLLNSCVYVVNFVHGAIFFEYIFSCIDDKSEELLELKKYLSWLIGAAGLIRLVLVAAGVYFRISPDGHYQTTDAFVFSFFFIPVITMFACGIAAGAGIPLKRLSIMLSYPFATLVMLIIAVLKIDYANPLISISLSLILIYCSLFVDAEKMKSTLNESFQMYISDGIANKLDSMENVAPGGSVSNSTMLFCSLHRFGEEMEAMEPEDAVILLNHFYSSMTDIVEARGGRLMEYPGYGLFCMFGDFNGCQNHADEAVKAALEMKEQLKTVNAWGQAHHYPQLKFGIGINTGDVVIGNVGSQNHLRYSAIGKHVNLASRTETYAGDGEIVITQNTQDACSEKTDTELVGFIIPKGIANPMHVYKLI